MIHLPHPLLDALIHRGVTDIDSLLNPPSFAEVIALLKIEDISDAVDRLLLAVREREPILLFGDYDCDGILGVGILQTVLQALGAKVRAYLPHRDEGYGFGSEAAFRAAREHFGIVVTIDNGIHAARAIDLARRLGVEVLVVDHHRRSGPVAATTVWSEDLSGAALAWVLAAALLERVKDRQREERLLALSPFAAVAGVADCVPLVGAERALVRLGMQQMASTHYPALRRLLALARVPEGAMPTARDIAFGIAPRINAAGRMAHPELALQTIFASSVEEAERQVTVLDTLNQRRRTLEQEILPLLLREEPCSRGGMIFRGDEWPKGIAGILAARAAAYFHRPTIVLVRDTRSGLLTGSGRSIPGFDLRAAVAPCAPLLERFGGHAQAIGLTLRESELDPFRTAFRENTLGCAGLPEPSREEEAVLNLSVVSRRFWEACHALEPFGTGFPPLVFRVPQATFEKRRTGSARLGQGSRWLSVSVGADHPANGAQGDFLVEVAGNGATFLSPA